MLDIYTYIGDFLDYKGLAKLMLVSKEAHTCTHTRFLTASRPHALAYIVQAILKHRLNTPAHPFGFHSRTGNMLHFITDSPREIHVMTLFDADVMRSATAVEVSAVYTYITTGRCKFMGNITATLTPSLAHPMRAGSVQICKNNNMGIAFDYINHLDAIEWCPLQQPLLI